MALLYPTLLTGITTAFAAGLVPPPSNASRDEVISLLVDGYYVYAIAAQACSLLAPTQVYKSKLYDALYDSSQMDHQNYSDPAEDWAFGFESFWDGALFGATGIVTVIGGTAVLATSLETIWRTATETKLDTATVASQMATAIDVFTRTVLVRDTAVPPGVPPGCGPLPIF